MNFLFDRRLLIAPSLVVFLCVFMAPMSYFFVISFWRVRAYQLHSDFSIHNYLKVFSNYLPSLSITFGIALVTAIIVTSAAFLFAYVCRFKMGRYGTLLLFVALITLFGGYLTKIYAWKTILGSSGILNSALISLGLIDDPITALLYNPISVVIALVHYTLPLAILPLYGSLRSIEDLPLDAARDLGASRGAVVRDIVLPQCRSGLLTGFTLSFLLSAGDFVTPKLVGGPSTAMIGVFIQNQFGFRVNAPLGSAMSITVVIISILIIGIVGFAIMQIRGPRR